MKTSLDFNAVSALTVLMARFPKHNPEILVRTIRQLDEPIGTTLTTEIEVKYILLKDGNAHCARFVLDHDQVRIFDQHETAIKQLGELADD